MLFTSFNKLLVNATGVIGGALCGIFGILTLYVQLVREKSVTTIPSPCHTTYRNESD